MCTKMFTDCYELGFSIECQKFVKTLPSHVDINRDVDRLMAMFTVCIDCKSMSVSALETSVGFDISFRVCCLDNYNSNKSDAISNRTSTNAKKFCTTLFHKKLSRVFKNPVIWGFRPDLILNELYSIRRLLEA